MLKVNSYSAGWIHSYAAADQDNAAQAFGWVEKLSWLAVRALVGLASWNERRRISAELMAMDDRQLADIGLVRTDIDRVASGQYEDVRHVPKPSFDGRYASDQRLAA
ncbi:MAG: DUF1127 domain-containing protein [Alphaproteobacteria bacterium]|nr:DUF1127 domain-containing protein [Alphaproteobacteria bacterium]